MEPMKSRPILFSGPMVRALLDGSKTQTRRTVKGSAGKNWHAGQVGILDPGPVHWNIGGIAIKCPYGQPGDTLWCRETFADTSQSGIHPSDSGWVYRATDPEWGTELEGWKWKPSIFMPRDASRITLKITAIRCERLQEIGESDAWAEGVATTGVCYGKKILPSTSTGRERYKALWESINGPGSWDANPFVWAVSFRRVEP